MNTIIRAAELARGDHFTDSGVIKVVMFVALVRGTDIEITYRPKGNRSPSGERKMTVHKDIKIEKVN